MCDGWSLLVLCKFVNEVTTFGGFCSLIRLRLSPAAQPSLSYPSGAALSLHLPPPTLPPCSLLSPYPRFTNRLRLATACVDVFRTQQVPVPICIQFSDPPRHQHQRSHAPIRNSSGPCSPPDPSHSQTQFFRGASEREGSVMVSQGFEGPLG